MARLQLPQSVQDKHKHHHATDDKQTRNGGWTVAACQNTTGSFPIAVDNALHAVSRVIAVEARNKDVLGCQPVQHARPCGQRSPASLR